MKGFGSDNHAAVHPQLLQAMIEANIEHAPSYGSDKWTEQAIEEFHKLFGKEVPVYFVYNGTAANALAVRSAIQPWQAVFCSEIAHLHLDECGAPEFLSGAKIYTLPQTGGKISVESLEKAFIRRGDQHFSQAHLVSITQPTEVGTCYSITEIREIVNWAHTRGLKVHVDGARIANAVVSLKTDFKSMLTDTGVDIVSFGGTKNGLMFGEALVFLNKTLAEDFVYIRKQAAQLPSKTRFISAPFLYYLQTGLWRQIAEHTLRMAQLLKEKVKDIPEVQVTHDVQSNAVFAKIPQKWVKPLREKYFFYVWDEKTFECRWMMSFDTTIAEIEGFTLALKELSSKQI